MLKETPQLYKRKGGSVVKLTAEISIVEYGRFARAIELMKMSKKQAVGTALSFWLNSLPKEVRGL